MATPSLAMVPSGYKDGTLYNVLPNNATGDFDVTRGSLATRVNKNGLIEPVGTLGADVVLNGDFEEVGADQILNGDFSQEGSEEIINGDFATDSDWLFGGSASISNGSANFTGSGDLIRQNATTPSGTYKITFTVTGTGYLVVRNYTGGVLYKEYANISQGEHTIYVEKNEDGIMFQSFGFASSIDNVSVVEVGQNWTLFSGWYIGENKLVADGTTTTFVTQDIASLTGKSLKVSFDILDYVSGTFRISPTDRADALDERYSGNGSYEVFYESTVDYFRFQQQAFNGSITNITIEEVGQNWTLTDGCSITAQGARILSDGTNQFFEQTNALVIGDTYEMEYEITESVSGSLSAANSFGSVVLLKNTIGVHRFYGIATNTPLTIKRSGGVTDVTIDNIKIKRLTGDDTPRIDYTDGGCPVLLTEPQSTNLIIQSNDVLALNGGVVELSSGTSPDGTQNAFKVTFGVDQNDGARIYINGSTALPSTEYTLSVYAKSINGDGTFNVRIDTNTQSTVGSNNFTSTSEWQRYSFTFTTDAACSSFSSNTRLKGLTANNEILFYGLQVEELSYATSLIPTYGAVRTRLQDTVILSGTSSDFNSAEGTLFVEISALADDLTNRSIRLSDGSSSNYVGIRFNDGASNRIYTRVNVASAIEYFNLDESQNITDTNKIAIRYKDSDFATFINGLKVSSQTSGSSFPINTLNYLTFNGSSVISEPFFGKTSQVQVFKTALSDNELQTLTTI